MTAPMPPPAYNAHGVTLLTGDACHVLAGLPHASVDCVVTSPPYWGMRDYGVEGQYGLERSTDDYIDRLRRVFEQLHRVLVPHGTVWLNLGDRYSVPAQTGRRDANRVRLDRDGQRHYPSIGDHPPRPLRLEYGVAAKNLIGLPWRIALQLQRDGWIIRNAVIWHKPNAMPQSVRDRLSTRYEIIFLLTRQGRYYFDLDAIRAPSARTRPSPTRRHSGTPAGQRKHATAGPRVPGGVDQTINLVGGGHDSVHPKGANPGDVWSIGNRPYAEAHFAVFPPEIPLRCIASGCPPAGLVCDPFSGAGTTAIAARQLGRRAIGIDINPAYHELAIKRLNADGHGRPP